MIKGKYLDFLRMNKDRTLPIFTYPIANSLGINSYDLTVNPSKHAKVVKYIDDLADFGFAMGLMDLSIEAEAFGCPLEIDEINLPKIGPGIVETMNDARILNIPDVKDFRFNAYIQSLRNIKSLINDKPVIAAVASPFTLAGILLGTVKLKEHLEYNHEIIYMVLEKATIFLNSYYKKLIASGADGLFICDPMSGFLNHTNFDQFSTIFLNRLVDEIDDEIFILYHNCAEVSNTIENIKNVHADIYHFGDATDMEDILKTFPKNKLVMGNISPLNVFQKKSSKGVERATHSLLKKCAHYDNFLISPGCDLPSTIPFKKVISYLKAIDKFYDKK